MSLDNSVVNRISRLFERKSSKTTPYDTQAVVRRVEGRTAWVHIPGGVDETPVRIGVDVQPGDSVMVRVSGGKAWILGNETTPPSNDKKAVAKKMSQDMSDRKKDITIANGRIRFIGNTLVIKSKNFNLNEAGDATFSGKLKAADGEFLGTLTFDWAEDTPGMHTKIKIGSDRNSPISVESVNHDESTGIYPDMICIGADEGRTWAQMDIYDGFQWSSDRRVKSDIKKLEDTDLVAHLNPVEYKFTSDAARKKHYGFIAQEVQEVMPDAVKENKNGYLGLNYLEFIAPAIAMIQRQEKEITELKAEVKALKEKING